MKIATLLRPLWGKKKPSTTTASALLLEKWFKLQCHLNVSL